MSLNAASDQGLHCLPMSHKSNARLIWVKATTRDNCLGRVSRKNYRETETSRESSLLIPMQLQITNVFSCMVILSIMIRGSVCETRALAESVLEGICGVACCSAAPGRGR